MSPTDLNRIAVGAGGGFLDITTDGGATWTDINLITLVPGYQGFVTNVTWQDNQNLWITVVAQATGVGAGDQGHDRQPRRELGRPRRSRRCRTGFPTSRSRACYFDPRDPSRATIYAATHVGIYRTTDGGANWEPYGAGLPTVRVNDIYMPPDGGFIRIATYGRGIWELPQLELVRAVLSDDDRSCDHDGVLDNGERGELTITLKNQGRNDVHHVKADGHVQQPARHVPARQRHPLPAKSRVAGRARTPSAWRCRAPSGLETTDFEIAIEAGAARAARRARRWSRRTRSTTTTRPASVVAGVGGVRAHTAGPSRATRPPRPTSRPGSAEHSPRLRHVFWGPDNNGQTDGERLDLPDEQSLVSPTAARRDRRRS